MDTSAPVTTTLSTTIQAGTQNVQIAGLQTPIATASTLTELPNALANGGENVTVQHYLLTSIITNTSTGKQTSQLITQPVLLPQSNQGASQNIVLVPSLNIPLEIVPDNSEIELVPSNTPVQATACNAGDATDTLQSEVGNNYTPLRAISPNSCFVSDATNPVTCVTVDTTNTNTDASQSAFTDSTLIQEYDNFPGVQNHTLEDVTSKNLSSDLQSQTTLDSSSVQEVKFLQESSQDSKLNGIMLNDFFSPIEMNSDTSSLLASLKGQKDRSQDFEEIGDDVQDFLSEEVSKELSEALEESNN